MLRRSRDRGADPAVVERVGRLLLRPAVRGGWVPPADDDESLPDASWDDEPEPDARSWSPPAAPDARPTSPRQRLLPDTLAGGRLDPGHRGAVALLLVCLLAAAIAAGVVLRARPQEVEVPVVAQAGTPLPGAAEPSPSPASGEVVVAVVGEVVAPGIVRLPAGSRVDDAVRAAGGLAPGGSPGLLNLARRLVDGEQVVVGPEARPDAAAGAATGGSGGLVNINAATAGDLDGLPGIGPVLAERIVDWRTEHGAFASVDQLREVPGIGEAKYASIKSKVTV